MVSPENVPSTGHSRSSSINETEKKNVFLDDDELLSGKCVLSLRLISQVKLTQVVPPPSAFIPGNCNSDCAERI